MRSTPGPAAGSWTPLANCTTGLPWLHRTVPGAHRAGAYVFAASMLGGVAFPPLLGTGIELTSVTAVPVLLFALNALCLGAIWWIIRATRTARLPDRDGERPESQTPSRASVT